MAKKQIIIHIVFSFVIAFVKIYQIIFIEGFWGSFILYVLKQVGFLLNSDFDREIIGLRGSKRMGPEGGSRALALSISTHLSEGL